MRPAERSGAIAMLQMALYHVPPAQRRLAAIDVLLEDHLFLDDQTRLELIRELKDPKSEISIKLKQPIEQKKPHYQRQNIKIDSPKYTWFGLALWILAAIPLSYILLQILIYGI